MQREGGGAAISRLLWYSNSLSERYISGNYLMTKEYTSTTAVTVYDTTITFSEPLGDFYYTAGDASFTI